MTAQDLHTLTGAHALDALPGDERAAFERHLAGCEPCAREIAGFAAATARLARAAAAVPPPELRQRVLRRVAEVPQEPRRPAGPSRARSVRGAWRLSRWALAACVAVAAGLGGAAVREHQRADAAGVDARRAERAADEVTAVLAAPDARVRGVRLVGGATGTVVVSRARDRAVLLVSGMAEPPPGRVYELWFDDGGTMRAAGLMDPRRSAQSVVTTGSLGGASALGITQEPAGGSRTPTSDPVALLELPG